MGNAQSCGTLGCSYDGRLLMRCAQKGEAGVINECIQEHPSLLAYANFSQFTVWHVAAQYGHEPVLRSLADQTKALDRATALNGGSRRCGDSKGRPPAHCSHVLCFDLGIAFGGWLQPVVLPHLCPVLAAVELIAVSSAGPGSRTCMLFNKQLGCAACDARHLTPDVAFVCAFRVVVAPAVDVVQRLVNSRSNRSQTPLMLAAGGGHAGCVSYLLSLGADIWTADRMGARNALHYAARYGHSEVIKVLVQHAQECRTPAEPPSPNTPQTR